MLQSLLTNRMLNPLGMDLGIHPRLSFINTEEDQTACIQVSLDQDFSQIVHDSGEKPIDSICYTAQVNLMPRTRYHWRVMSGDFSQSAWFETGKMDEAWMASWIGPDFSPSWHPQLLTSFSLSALPVSARVYICGLGLYEMTINQQRVSDEFLSPGLCAYDKWLPYQVFDVAQHLRVGVNEINVLLGNGWYKGRYGLNRKMEFHYGEEFALIAELHLLMADGSETLVVTNPQTWQAKRSTTLSSGIFDGEVVDATQDTSAVYKTKPVNLGLSRLEARKSPGIKTMNILKPVQVLITPKGDTLLDMGQNMVGMLRFVADEPRASEIHLEFCEVLQGGEFYRDNLRTALCEYRYVSDGTKQMVCPRFTFYGFRYVRVSGLSKPVRESDFEGLVLYSHMHRTGHIRTANEKVNRLFENTLWGQMGNYLDTPTDCPQRDERMGWTGDAQVFFGTAAYNMDVSAFFTKFLYDMRREQEFLAGDIPVVIPKHDVKQTGACAWGDAATIIPWNLFVRYGDKELLRQNYPLMRGWVEHVHGLDDGSRLWKGSFHYGDWLSLDGEDPLGNRFGGTERTYLASCYYRYSTLLTAKAAGVLGYQEDADRYMALSDEIRDAIVREYLTQTGRLAVTTQTAYILALMFDIVPEEYRNKTAYSLRLKLKESGYHLRTGFIGTPYLCKVLSETGSNDIAYRLLLQEDFPSWLYQVNMGATTIWERWNSILPDGSISDTGMNSLNHYSYGSIVEWLYSCAAGIRPLASAPGFRKFLLAPMPDRSLGWLEAEYQSPAGNIESAWEYDEDGKVSFRFAVPLGAEARIMLPDGQVHEVTGGEHHYSIEPAVKDEWHMPMNELLNKDEGGFALKYPGLYGMMLFRMMAGTRSLSDLAREGFRIMEKQND